ncbi:MAG TPA: DUF255 domain-containing protein [Chitinophagales bacterium]|nr:DUF255 domain-containing protein [Chitinophagales bacterium]
MNKKYYTTVLISILTIVAFSLVSFIESPEEEEQANQVKWMTLDEVVEAQKESPKPVIVNLFTTWCVWCSKMDESTFNDPGLISYINENFHALKFDAEADINVSLNGQEFPLITINNRKVHKLAWEWGAVNNRIGYPTIVVLDEKMNKLQAFPGFKDVEAMRVLARYFVEDVYKSKSWQEYLSSGN